MARFDPPGLVEDLTEAQKDLWSADVSGWVDDAVVGDPGANDGPRLQFFNALAHPPAEDATTAVISWVAFPRGIRQSSSGDRQRWRRADQSRDVQDEYCEWSVARDPVTNKIVRVTFTCEAPEYWRFLAAVNPGKVLELYREFVDPRVQMDDLFTDGVYQARNRWNNSTSRGAMHLIQGANTLTAEIELAAASTIRRVRNGTEITDAQTLIQCSRFGDPRRNSDPHIGEEVNKLARLQADVTIKNPVGLYFNEFEPQNWETPDGEDPKKFWTWVRGVEGHRVRAVYEVPPGQGYVVGDILINGRPIEFGSQITDFITIKIIGLATRIGESKVEPFNGCKGELEDSPVEGVIDPLEAVRTLTTTRLTAVSRADTRDEVGQLVPRTREFELVEATDELTGAEEAPIELKPYPMLPASSLRPRFTVGPIIAYASPDSTFAVTKRLIDAARHSIVIGIYDFSSSALKALLIRAMQRGVRVSIMLDTNNNEAALLGELRLLGATTVVAPSASARAPIRYFPNAHEKIIVIDGEWVMVQSGNWSDNSIPFNEGDGELTAAGFQPGNRDMGLAVRDRSLAEFFADLIARDMRLALGEPVEEDAPEEVLTLAELFEEAPPVLPEPLFSSLTLTPSAPIEITPVLTPENFPDVCEALLRSAQRTILIEQQYVRRGPVVGRLLDGIRAAKDANPDLKVRVIVSPKFLDQNDRRQLVEAMQRIGLEAESGYRFLSPKHFVHCHNKLVIVDDSVLLGSQNWSSTGIMANREAGLLVKNAAITGYFARIFEADWTMSDPREEDTPISTPPLSSIDFARGGVVRIVPADYREV